METPKRHLSGSLAATDKHNKALDSCIGYIEPKIFANQVPVFTRPQQRLRRPSNSMSCSPPLINEMASRTTNYNTSYYNSNNKNTLNLSEALTTATKAFLDILAKNLRKLKKKDGNNSYLVDSFPLNKLSVIASRILVMIDAENLGDEQLRAEISSLLGGDSGGGSNLISYELFDEIMDAANAALDLAEDDMIVNNEPDAILPIYDRKNVDEAKFTNNNINNGTTTIINGNKNNNGLNTSIGGGEIREAYPIPSAPFLSDFGEIKIFYPVLTGDLDNEHDDEIMADYWVDLGFVDGYSPVFYGDDEEDPIMV
ncbi:1122_t:CDS:2 [Ambispora gerdemannii]|uniref:1122_t:CDS:1 n=1 Tax=Ambispora gerdemannii TaxID=144530 RepID=A0A9N9AHZ7_9GLOM|nr:1122_t:CDS:2 [Ambispora gerdemannii]